MIIQLSHLHDGVNELPYVHSAETLDLVGLAGYENIFFEEPIQVHVEIQKVTHQYFLKVDLHTQARMICDRCLDEFYRTLDDQFRLVYNIESTTIIDEVENVEEYRTLDVNTTQIDLTADIREALILSVPYKILCMDGCVGLCSQCGTNLNHASCQCHVKQIDTRWEALRKLQNPELQ